MEQKGGELLEQLWEQMKMSLQKCERCDLCRTRTQAVWGVGNPQTRVLLVGEAPGKNEDEQGEPFVGRSGQLLDKMLAVVDLDRKRNIYITNIVKCRPPENRDPAPEEVICGSRPGSWSPGLAYAWAGSALHGSSTPALRSPGSMDNGWKRVEFI